MIANWSLFIALSFRERSNRSDGGFSAVLEFFINDTVLKKSSLRNDLPTHLRSNGL